MLSYQHIYHAGNMADVHKHALLAWMLDYLTVKPKPLTYLETHAGRGLYDLSSDEALKTGEAAQGITLVEEKFPKNHPYRQALRQVRATHGENAYPGSPVLAKAILREEDRVHIAELHPQEAAALRKTMRGQAKVHLQSGFDMAMSLCPPEPRRGLILIDPSYELAQDYSKMPGFVAKLNKTWNVGTIALWYPILKDLRHTSMVAAIKASNLPKLFISEVGFPPAREGHGMIGSGMLVVNAPYGLEVASKDIASYMGSTSG